MCPNYVNAQDFPPLYVAKTSISIVMWNITSWKNCGAFVSHITRFVTVFFSFSKKFIISILGHSNSLCRLMVLSQIWWVSISISHCWRVLNMLLTLQSGNMNNIYYDFIIANQNLNSARKNVLWQLSIVVGSLIKWRIF